jgi:hypothetical protein
MVGQIAIGRIGHFDGEGSISDRLIGDPRSMRAGGAPIGVLSNPKTGELNGRFRILPCGDAVANLIRHPLLAARDRQAAIGQYACDQADAQDNQVG